MNARLWFCAPERLCIRFESTEHFSHTFKLLSGITSNADIVCFASRRVRIEVRESISYALNIISFSETSFSNKIIKSYQFSEPNCNVFTLFGILKYKIIFTPIYIFAFFV